MIIAGINIFYVDSPLGVLQIEHSETGLRKVSFSEPEAASATKDDQLNPFEKLIAQQMKDYFSGSRRKFDIPLEFRGTEFQEKVWRELGKIPYGEVITYAALAKRLGDSNCIRAAASANGKNPFAVIIPCHRVIGSGGKLTGYMGGMWRKQWLLEHEERLTGYGTLIK